MRIITAFALSLVVLFTFSVAAQRGGGQPQPSITQTTIVTAADVAARTAGGNLIRLSPYNVNMELRNMGQAASVHETEAELFYVIEGAGTLVTGGSHYSARSALRINWVRSSTRARGDSDGSLKNGCG